MPDGPRDALPLDDPASPRIVPDAMPNGTGGDGGARPRVRLGGHAERAGSDTAVGIPREELPGLVERFHRVPNARSRTHEGTGIGLAITRDLARGMGGDLAVRSSPGERSTFTLTLPRAR